MKRSSQSDSDSPFPTIDEGLLARIRSKIVEEFQPEAVLLIGSAARRETHPESDVDLVVVMALGNDETPWDKASQIHRLFRGWKVPLDIVVLTPREFERGQDLPGHLARTAAREGRVLYERSA